MEWEEKKKEEADNSPHTGAGVYLLDSNLCLSQFCLLSVWLTSCPNLGLAPDPGSQIPWSCIHVLAPSSEARSDPDICPMCLAIELLISLPDQPDMDLATPEEALWKQGSCLTLPGILNTQ